MNVKRFTGKLRSALDVINLKARISYSQVGEDLIIDYLFASLGLKLLTYPDIGTNQPVLYNNTYLFYKKGSRGVCIEPDIEMYKKITKERPGDKVLNIGIGLNDMEKAPFYLFSGPLSAWSTFSEAEAKIREAESGNKPKMVNIPLRLINHIIEQYFDKSPDFISLDVEGLDLEILKSLDFNRFRPIVICVETISFSITNKEEKLHDIIDFIHSKDYITYADTYVNTIFCSSELFNRER